MRITSKDLESMLERVSRITGNTNLVLSSWSDGRRRVYHVAEKLDSGGERRVSDSGTSREIYYFLQGMAKRGEVEVSSDE